MAKNETRSWEARRVTAATMRRVRWLQTQTRIVDNMIRIGWVEDAKTHAEKVCAGCYHQLSCNSNSTCIFNPVINRVVDLALKEREGEING